MGGETGAGAGRQTGFTLVLLPVRLSVRPSIRTPSPPPSLRTVHRSCERQGELRNVQILACE